MPPPTVQQLPLFDASDLIVSFVAHARSALVHIAHSAALFRFEAMAEGTYKFGEVELAGIKKMF